MSQVRSHFSSSFSYACAAASARQRAPGIPHNRWSRPPILREIYSVSDWAGNGQSGRRRSIGPCLAAPDPLRSMPCVSVGMKRWRGPPAGAVGRSGERPPRL